MLKATKIVKHYKKATNCAAYVMRPNMDLEMNVLESVCKRCDDSKCAELHLEAVNKARQLGGAYIYLCSKGLVYWTSPFYSGERFAGSFISGGVKKSEKNSDKVKSLAQLMLMCSDQISGMSYMQKNVVPRQKHEDHEFIPEKAVNERSQNENIPHDMERMLLASLRRGDNEEAQKILGKLLKILYQNVKMNFPVFRLKAVELAVLLSRAMADPKDIIDNTTLETTNRNISKIEESTNFDDITKTLSLITEKISGKIFSFHGVRHFSALRKAERFIWKHYTRKLSLQEIADASGLSAPYFSTVFKDEMGENLSNYLNRLRVEKAATMLVTTDKPISEVAVACGFEDQSWFSKIFKNNTGLTPGKYRELGIHAAGNVLG